MRTNHKYFLGISVTIDNSIYNKGKLNQVKEVKIMPSNNRLPKIALVIAPEEFRDEEFKMPYQTLNDNGIATVIASTQTGKATGMLGYSVEATSLIKDLKASELDGIVIVGGMGSPKFLWDNKELHKLLNELNLSKKTISAICLSTVCLAKAGLLNNVKATVWPSDDAIGELKAAKAIYLDQNVVEDGNIVTANGPQSAQEFADVVLKHLNKVKV